MSGYIGTQPVPQATQTRDSFTATSNQTSFATSGYTPNFLDVFLNGVKLAAADYTASNGSDVVLATGATTGDILEVVAYTNFDTANVTGAANFTVTGAFTSQGIDDNATSTAMTLDSSGNLLVGTTTAYLGAGVSQNKVGVSIENAYGIHSSANGQRSLLLNRMTSDGTVAEFRKDAVVVGSIGTVGGDMVLGTGDVGFRFDDGSDDLTPWNTNTNAARNAAINLGHAGARFKDLYLSGGVYLGGTGAANKLDDYEEGSWTPTLLASGLVFSGTMYGKYVKIGRIVHLTFSLYCTNISGTTSADFAVTGVPFNLETSAPWGAGSYTGDRLNFSRTVHKAPSRLTNSSFGFLSANNNGVWAWESHAFLRTGSDLRISITYETSS